MKQSTASLPFREFFSLLATSLIALFMVAGCASTEIKNKKRLVTEKLQRPNKIFIQDFVTNFANVAKDSVLTDKNKAKITQPTKAEIKIGRQLGSSMATQLVREINSMGIRAEKLKGTTKPQTNDIVLRGYILSVVQGEGVKRVVVGFGYGAAGLQTLVEGYQMTAKGLRKLGSANITAGGNKTPGGALGALSLIARANPIGLIVGGAVKGYGEISGSSKVDGLAKNSAEKIAAYLKVRFKEEGWIK